MNMITLKPSDFTGGPVHTFPGYVSNGHWMISKSLVSNAAVFATEDLIKVFAPKMDTHPRVASDNGGADRIIAAVPSHGFLVWTVQPWIYVSRTSHGTGRRAKTIDTECVVLTHSDRTCYVSREYLDRFGVAAGDVLHGAEADGSGALLTPDRLFVVMPVRIDADLAVLWPAASRQRNEDIAKAANAARDEAERLARKAAKAAAKAA